MPVSSCAVDSTQFLAAPPCSAASLLQSVGHALPRSTVLLPFAASNPQTTAAALASQTRTPVSAAPKRNSLSRDLMSCIPACSANFYPRSTQCNARLLVAPCDDNRSCVDHWFHILSAAKSSLGSSVVPAVPSSVILLFLLTSILYGPTWGDNLSPTVVAQLDGLSLPG